MSVELRPPRWDDLPPVTRWLAFSFLCGWALESAFGAWVNYYLGLVPLNVLGLGWLWQPFTYMFVHAGFLHFLFNAFMLWMLGPVLEPAMGSRRFLALFLFCGAAAGFCTTFVSPGSTRAVIGASGAIYGLLYAFAALYPDQTVLMYFLFPLTARQFVAVMAGLAFFLSFATPNSGVANFTHLSGLGAGWLYFRLGERMLFPGWNIFPRIFSWFARLSTHDDEDMEERVNTLLAKVSRRGAYSLTPEERDELAEYTRRRGGRA